MNEAAASWRRRIRRSSERRGEKRRRRARALEGRVWSRHAGRACLIERVEGCAAYHDAWRVQAGEREGGVVGYLKKHSREEWSRQKGGREGGWKEGAKVCP